MRVASTGRAPGAGVVWTDQPSRARRRLRRLAASGEPEASTTWIGAPASLAWGFVRALAGTSFGVAAVVWTGLAAAGWLLATSILATSAAAGLTAARLAAAIWVRRATP